MTNPNIIDYMRILYKINDIYSRFDLDEKDLGDEINYYHNKPDYSEEEIKGLQDICESEWKEVLMKLCEGLTTIIESKGDYKKILKVELSQVKKIYQKLNKEKITIDEYEKLYDDKFIDLRDSVEKEITKYEIENKRYYLGIVYGAILSAAVGILMWYFSRK